jgi:cytochrome P450
MVFASVKAVGLIAARNKYPMFDYYDRIKNIFTDTSSAIRKRQEFFKLSCQKVTDRLEREQERPDFLQYAVKNQDSSEKSLNRKEIDATAVIFLIAGSETTATLLSGATFLLLRNPAVYSKLVHEIRSKFTKQSEITMDAVNNMEYLVAFLQEALRYYPPVPTGFPRVVPQGGDTISGRYIPEGVRDISVF